MKRLIIKLLLLLALPVPVARAAGPTFAQGFTSNGQTVLTFGAQYGGSLYLPGIVNPSAPSVTVNTTGATSHTYYVVGHDGAAPCGSGHEGVSLPSTGTTVTNSSSPQNNSIGPLPTTYLYWDVLRDATNASIATCVASGSTVTDTNQSSSAYTAPTQNTTNAVTGAVFTNLSVTSLTVTTATVTTANVTTGNVTTANVGTLNNTSTPISTSGHINEPNNITIVAARNAANNADLPVIGTNASNEVVVGGTNVPDIMFGNPLSLTEQVAAPGASGRDVLWADSTSHSLRFNPNNTGSQYLHYSAAQPSTNRIPRATAVAGQYADSSIVDDTAHIIPNLPVAFPEVVAPSSGVINFDVCWGDSTAHGLKCNFNNSASNSQVMVFNTSFTSGHCTQALVSGGVTSFVDSGASCSASAAPSTWIGTTAGVENGLTATAYIGFGQSYDLAIRTSESNSFSILPSPNSTVTLKNLFCNWPTVANNVTAVVRDTHTGTTSSTTLTCTSTTGQTGCNDSTDTPTVAGGDYLDVKVSSTDSSHNSGNISCGFQITGA